MKPADSAYIIVGKFGSTYGIQGWIKIHTFTELNTNILSYTPWYIPRKNGNWSPLQIESSKIHNNGIIVKMEGYNSPEEARLLTGFSIGILRAQLPALSQNEYYWSDLIGLTVINQLGETLGKVTDLMETGSNDVLIVKGDKEHAIPYLPGTVVTQVDLNKQEIHVNWEL